MSTPDPRAEARNRASHRLRRMTVGTAALGVASVGLFGATAAFSNDGTHAAAGTVALAVTAGAGTTTASTDTSSGSSSSSTSTSTTVAGSSGTAHVSTGGS